MAFILQPKIFKLINIDLNFTKIHTGPIDNKSALVQVMAWYKKGNKSLFEPMMA